MPTPQPLLEVRDLRVEFNTRRGTALVLGAIVLAFSTLAERWSTPR